MRLQNGGWRWDRAWCIESVNDHHKRAPLEFVFLRARVYDVVLFKNKKQKSKKKILPQATPAAAAPTFDKQCPVCVCRTRPRVFVRAFAVRVNSVCAARVFRVLKNRGPYTRLRITRSAIINRARRRSTCRLRARPSGGGTTILIRRHHPCVVRRDD